MTGTPKHTVSPWLPGAEPGARIVRGIIRSEADARAIERSKSAIVQLLSSDLAIEPRRLSYAEVLARTVQAANLFKALSGDEQPSVAVIAPFLPEALIATWGGATAGVATPLNPALDIRQIASIMIAARSNILVTTTSKYGPGAWERVQEIAVL